MSIRSDHHVYDTSLLMKRLQSHPNVLWIFGEDLYPDLGCYGTPLVQTPNIDRLASQGTLFPNAFVTCPVCSPSRSAIITGCFQTSIGAHQHRSNRDAPLSEGIRLITDCFRDAGYFTCNSSGPPFDKPGKTDFNFRADLPFDGTDWSECPADRPFYAQVNIVDTHRWFSPDPENPVDPDAVSIPPYYPDHPLVRADWAQYLESIQVFDRKVGLILRRLDDEGLTENTIVFLISDHGRAHIRDKQFLYDGGIRVPCIVRWPSKIEAGTRLKSLVSEIDFAPTSLHLAGLEVPANMQGVCFLGPQAVQRDSVFAARDRCDGTVDRIRCIRTSRFKLIRNYHPERPYMQFNGYKKQQYPLWTLAPILNEQGKLTREQARFLSGTRPCVELYDLQSDPHESRNLVDHPNYRLIHANLRTRLDDWISTTADQGELPEDPTTEADEIQKMDENHRKRMRAFGLDPEISPEDHLKWWENRLLGPS